MGIDGAEGYCVNIPWSRGGVGDNDYVFAFERVVLPIGYNHLYSIFYHLPCELTEMYLEMLRLFFEFFFLLNNIVTYCMLIRLTSKDPIILELALNCDACNNVI